MTATPIPAGVRDDTIRQLTKIRDDFRRSSVIGQEVTLSPQPQGYYSDVLSDALDLLAGPARPDGVPEHAVAAVGWWVDAEDADGKSALFMPDGSVWDDGAAHLFRTGGQPVPPYQPDPDPEALLVEKIAADWTHPDLADSPTDPGYEPLGEPCSVCSGTTRQTLTCPRCRAWRDDRVPLVRPELYDRIVSNLTTTDPADSAPPVAGERTGPLGLNEGDRVRHMTSGRIAAFVRYAPRGMMLVESIESGERCIYAPELWEPVRDAQLEPAETLADIEAWLRSDARDETYLTPKGMKAVADRIEAASRPDPDTIPVNRDDLAEALDWVAWDADPKAQKAARRLRAALAAAGLPQEGES